MKTQLTKEQSQHLIDLGVPKGRASRSISEGGDNDIIRVDGGYITKRGTIYPIFTLTDLLMILPKEIKTEDNIYWQTILWTGISYFVGYRNHNTDEWLYQICLQEKLIDALYKLTVWYIENKKLKLCKK